MKKILTLLMFFILLAFSSQAFASKIPDNELNILKQSFPKLHVRFDGLVELPDGTNYLPVFPIQAAETSDVKITKTIPNNTNLKNKPDFVMFNTNFALFKIIQNKDKKTIISSNDIPYEIKMSILPQDLLVPTGFQIPESLKLIAGDLIIPISDADKDVEIKTTNVSLTKDTSSSTVDFPKSQLISKTIKNISGKKLFTTSFNKNEVVVLNPNGKAYKKIIFPSIPSDMKITNNSKYLLVTTLKNGNIYVIDTDKIEALKEIKTGEKPANIAVSPKDNLAYVSNRGESTISVIDTISMQPKEVIKVTGHPGYITLSPSGEKLFYLDTISGIVYYVEKKEENYLVPYVCHPQFKSPNLSKIQISDDKIYSLDRGNNKLEIFYMKEKPISDEIVNVSDITPVDETFNSKAEKKLVDYNYYDNNDGEFVKKKEKVTLKQHIRSGFRKLLYYKDDVVVTQRPINPDNKPQVLVTVSPREKNDTPKVKKKKTLKTYFLEFMHYKETPISKTAEEQRQFTVNEKMDFISAENRTSDFMVTDDKIYLLCSDTYEVLIYDKNSLAYLGSISLNTKGYYNSIKLNDDNQTGLITNISSKELVIFDTLTDTISKTIPLDVNVHNVKIIGK